MDLAICVEGILLDLHDCLASTPYRAGSGTIPLANARKGHLQPKKLQVTRVSELQEYQLCSGKVC